MRQLQPEFYILSGALAGDDEHDALAKTDTLAAYFETHNLAAMRVNGVYKNVAEPAVLVMQTQKSRGDDFERAVLRMARQYGQESVLHVTPERNAALIYCDGERREPLGRFREVDETEALRHDAYTEYCGRFWVCGYAA